MQKSNIVEGTEFVPIKEDSIKGLVESAVELFPASSYIYFNGHRNGLSLSTPTSPYIPQEDSLVLPFEGRVAGYVKSYRSILFRLDMTPKAPFDYGILKHLGDLIEDDPISERDRLRFCLRMSARYVISETSRISLEDNVHDLLSTIPPRVQAARENDDRDALLRGHPLRMYPLVIESNLGNKNVSLNLDEPNHEGRFGSLWLTYVEDLVINPGKSYSNIDKMLDSIGFDVSSMHIKASPFYER